MALPLTDKKGLFIPFLSNCSLFQLNWNTYTHAQQSGKEEKTKEAEKNKKKYAGVFFYVFFYTKDDPGGTTHSRQKTAG